MIASIGLLGDYALNRKSGRSCYIVSLKYSPGLCKEFVLLGNNLRRYGWAVTYLLSSGYSWLIDGCKDGFHFLTRSMTLRELISDAARFSLSTLQQVQILFEQSPPQFLLIYNPHPSNFALARLASQICPEGIRAVYLHEPFVPDKSSYGKLRALYIHLAECFQTLTLNYTTCVIVPSVHAQSLFDLRYPEYPGQVYLAPILLPDRPCRKGLARRYISLIGNLNQSRGLDDFLALANYAAAQGEHLEFKIVTRSPIMKALQSLSSEAREMLEIVNKPIISDEEIADVVAQSIAIFLPHKQAAQSGNIPIAFREGTPVIARDIPGLSQHVHHGKNGYLISYEPNPAELREAVRFVQDNFAALSHQARKDFEDVLTGRRSRQCRWAMPTHRGVSISSSLPESQGRS